MKKIECDLCGSEIKRYPSQINSTNFCSKNCSKKFKSKKKEVECKECGKKMLKRPSKINEENNFCSLKCSSKYMRNRIEVKCSECGEFFHKVPSEVSDRNFCSKKCQKENYSKKITVKCQVCASEIERSPSHIGDTVFCSYDCEGEWISNNRSGENNPRWKGGKERYYGPNWTQISEQVRARDDYKCQRCGVKQKELDRKLDVHHKNKLKDFKVDGSINFNEANNKENLISYCRSCHTLVEGERSE